MVENVAVAIDVGRGLLHNIGSGRRRSDDRHHAARQYDYGGAADMGARLTRLAPRLTRGFPSLDRTDRHSPVILSHTDCLKAI